MPTVAEGLINTEYICYMLIEERTNTAYPCNYLFERAKITGQKVVLRCLVTSEYLILFTRQLEGETAASVKVWKN
jgi:hypothetical protein